MLNDFGQYLADRSARTADVRDATITGYEGNGVYDCQLVDTGATVFATARVGIGRLDIGTQCVVAPMAAAGAANAPWKIISADTAKATPAPFVPPAAVPIGPSLGRIFANPTILSAGGPSVDVILEGSGLAAGPTYGDAGIIDETAPDITSTRVAAHVKALATLATGTITTTGTAVVGVGTNFTHFVDGQLFIIASELFRITGTPADDTHLTLDHAPVTDVTDSAYSVGYAIAAAGTTIGDFFQVIAGSPPAAVLYGVASAGGAHDNGTLFQFDTGDNSVTALYEFNSASDPAWAPLGRTEFIDGVLYFACSADGGASDGAIMKFEISTSTLTLIHAFDGTTGSLPEFGVIAVAGKLYGVTANGGDNGRGVIFKIDPADDAFTVIHSFDPDTTGVTPTCLSYDGVALYGSTQGFGGTGTNSYGTVFRINTSDDSIDVLYAYTEASTESFGAWALSSVTGIGDGEILYLVTQTGGSGGYGTIAKVLISTGVRTDLIESTSTSVATTGRAWGPLTQVGDVFYGLSEDSGGASNDGTVFKFDPAGPTLSGVFSFSGSDGESGSGSGLLLIDGDLYAVTPYGGSSGVGTIGKLQISDETYTMLHEFVSAEGSNPFTVLVGT